MLSVSDDAKIFFSKILPGAALKCYYFLLLYNKYNVFKFKFSTEENPFHISTETEAGDLL